MREEARQERQRATHRALYQRFAAGEGSPIAQPAAPELTGIGHYLGEISAEPDAAAPSTGAEAVDWQQPATGSFPALEPAAAPGGFEDPEADAQLAPAAAVLPGQHLSSEQLDEEHARRRKRTKRKRNLVMLATVLIFALVVAGSVYFVQALLKKYNPDDYPGPGGATVEFTVEDGWGVGLISRKLEELDVVSNDRLFTEAVADSDQANKVIHPGTYLLKQQMPAAGAAEIMVDNRPDKVFYIGLKANLRLEAALQEIADGSGIELADLQDLADQPQKFGLPDSVTNLEGWLHPGEYRFPLETSAADVLSEMVKRTKASLDTAGVSDLDEGYRVLKIASILQAEARPADYATVAGAIENRLDPDNRETHGLLQVDSSVIYGLDRYSLQFSEQEKQDAANKYNTYVHRGLPPTPIGSPAAAAIEAAAQPQDNGYYYWVTVNIHTGETKFASTYAEHQRNQNEFRAWCEANPGVC